MVLGNQTRHKNVHRCRRSGEAGIVQICLCLPLYPFGFKCLDTICFKLMDWALAVWCDQSDRSSAPPSHSASGRPSKGPCIAFDVRRAIVHLPIRCRRRPSAICRPITHVHVWPVQRSWAVISNASMPVTLQIWSTSVFGFFSFHRTCAKRRRQRLWNCSFLTSAHGDWRPWPTVPTILAHTGAQWKWLPLCRLPLWYLVVSRDRPRGVW